MVGFHKRMVDLLLRLQPDVDGVLIVLISPQIEPLIFKADRHAETAIFTPEHASKTAGIIAPVFSFIEKFHTGSIEPMKTIRNLSLNFLFQASATSYISIY